MASLHRIALFDSLGDELFSGKSLLSEPPMPKVIVEDQTQLEMDDEEPCPETLRSSVFVRVHDRIVDPSQQEDDDGTVDVTFSDPMPALPIIEEDETSEIRATPASLGRHSEPEISVDMIDALFEDEDHAA